MRPPPQLRVALGPSRIATAFITMLALATFAVVVALPLPPACVPLAAVALGGWAWIRIVDIGLRRAPKSVVEVTLSLNRLIVVRHRDGSLLAGHVRGTSYVSPSLTSIVWKPDGARWSRSVLVLPDMLDADEARRLRVLLRYGSSEVEAGAPASHA